MNCDRCPCPGTCLRLPAYCRWAAKDPPDPVEVRHICEASARSAGPAGDYPPLATQAANLGRALFDWAVSGFSMASPEEADRRLAICEGCERFDPGPRRCRHLGCGCFLDQKIKMKTEKCPIGKW